MNRARSAIGYWRFARIAWGDVSHFNEATVQRMAMLATEALAPSARHQLLLPVRAILD
jgi:hypothetical protein